MESLIGLVNRIQQACTKLGDYGGSDNNNTFSSLWEALPSVAVLGGQVTLLEPSKHSISTSFHFVLFLILYIYENENRVQVNLRF
jgi:hypothetical protein